MPSCPRRASHTPPIAPFWAVGLIVPRPTPRTPATPLSRPVGPFAVAFYGEGGRGGKRVSDNGAATVRACRAGRRRRAKMVHPGNWYQRHDRTRATMTATARRGQDQVQSVLRPIIMPPIGNRFTTDRLSFRPLRICPPQRHIPSVRGDIAWRIFGRCRNKSAHP